MNEKNAQEVIAELQTQRQKFLDGLAANKSDINLDIFEDFYPDKAHFIFELLQNAEDAEATECHFHLDNQAIVFRHNGKRAFTEQDVKSITGIHNSTKTKDENKIGKFGVGFKSVFIYTLTPQIHSAAYHFEIRDLVMPTPIPALLDIGDQTSFRFPFNNPEKSPAESYKEIKSGLEKLSKLTLLFLKNINRVSWKIDNSEESELLRVEHPENHIEVLQLKNGEHTSSSHFLRFTRHITTTTDHTPAQRVNIAFLLESLPENQLIQSTGKLNERFKIIPAIPGQVSVFFPAEKETSNLRFHIHAPFVPTLDRSSIKDVQENSQLYEELSQLASESLEAIKDLKFLNNEFLSILPNSKDHIPPRYQGIRDAIIKKMTTFSLTPKYPKGHAPAKQLLQANVTLKRLLSNDDLRFIFKNENFTPQWAIGSNQKNDRIDRFLGDLKIRQWGSEEFIKNLTSHLHRHRIRTSHRHREYKEWLSKKPAEWMQLFYVLLYRDFKFNTPRLSLLESQRNIKNLAIVKLENGDISFPSNCYFLSDNPHYNESANWVSKEIFFTYRQDITLSDEARQFLTKIGVKEVGPTEQIEFILKKRYQRNNFHPEISDLPIFIEHIKNHPADVDLFEDLSIFLTSTETWATGTDLYLDAPFINSGLRELYAYYGNYCPKCDLSEKYASLHNKKEIVDFANLLGATTSLKIEKSRCHNNPEHRYLRGAPGQWRQETGINRDFHIKDFEDIFDTCSSSLSEVIWDTLCDIPKHKDFFTATYRNNKSSGTLTAPSLLVHQLKNTAWVPQKGLPPVTPELADSTLLPEGFPFDSGWPWVDAVDFGSAVEKNKKVKQKESQILRDALGIEDEASVSQFLDLCKNFKKLTPEQQKDYTRKIKSVIRCDIDEPETRNTERRARLTRKEAQEAPEREKEKRERTVQLGLSADKQEAKSYLRQQYTNNDDVMICQICKSELPFKTLSDNDYYFEAIPFLPELRKKEHRQNYLALCPNHAAMFKHANHMKDHVLQIFKTLNDETSMGLKLADDLQQITFSKKHVLDLQAILDAEATFE